MYSTSKHENRVLTACGCVGSDGQGVMEDVKRIEIYEQYMQVNVHENSTYCLWLCR